MFLTHFDPLQIGQRLGKDCTVNNYSEQFVLHLKNGTEVAYIFTITPYYTKTKVVVMSYKLLWWTMARDNIRVITSKTIVYI